MVTLLFFLIRIDSLPPIPDLSQVLFPEPHLWMQPAEKRLSLSLHGGHNFSGECDFLYHNLDFYMDCDLQNDWDSIVTASGKVAYTIPLAGILIVPSANGFFYKRIDEYRFLAPHLDAIIQLPWSFLSSSVNAELWQINGLNYQEYRFSTDVVFDRIIYMPHFVVNGIYSGNNFEPTVAGKLHINHVHLSIGSLISRSFPSPIFRIQYLKPNLRFGARFMNGVLSQTLRQQFDPVLPLQYRISIPAESLKTSIELDCNFELNDQILSWRASYNSWHAKNTPSANFVINAMNDVEELKIYITLINSIRSNDMRLHNSLNVSYTWLDSSIAFIPRHAVYDTLLIIMGPVEISTSVTEYAQREGVTHALPAIFLIEPGFGYKYKGLTLFFKVYNATDEKDEIYDGYFLKGRQYAIGFKFNHDF